MFQAAWSKPLKVHRGLGSSYIQIHSLMKFWQSSSAQSLDNNPIWQAQFWATLPQTGPKLGRPRDRNSSWGVTNRFLSSDLCSAPMDSEQVDWPKKTWLSNKCNIGARGPLMWWGSSGQSFYLRCVSSPMGFVSKSRSVCPHTPSGNDPGASFVSCKEGPAHESCISLKMTYLSSLTTDLLWPLQGQTLEWPTGQQLWHHAGSSGEAAQTLQFAQRKNPKLDTKIFRFSALWSILKPKAASLPEMLCIKSPMTKPYASGPK